MANHADGSIVIDTRIDTSGAYKTVSEMRRTLTGKLRDIGATMEQSARSTSSAYAQASQAAKTATQSSRQLDAALAKTEKRISAVKGKLTEYYKSVDAIKASTDDALKQTTSDDQAARVLEIEEIQLQQVNDKYAEQLELLKSLEAEQQRLATARAAANIGPDSSAGPDIPDGEIGGVWARLGHIIKSAAANVAAAARNLAVSALRKLAQAAGEAAKGLLKLTARGIVNGVKRLGGWLSGAARSLLLFGRSNKKLTGGLGTSFKQILKYGLGIRSLYVLFNRLRSAIKEGFGNLAQYSDAVNQSISSVLSSLTKLKNQIAAAFAPLVEIAAPVLKTLVDGLTNASAKLAQLIAALTGKKTFIKAKDVQEDYADSLDKTADKAKEAKKQLAGFDELEILKKDSTKDDEKTDPSDMFEDIEIPEEMQDIADDIRDVLEGEGWTPIGQTIGEKIKKALGSIDWESIKAKAWELGKKLATLLNGILETPGLFYNLGKTLAEAINTAFSFVDGFAWNFHWKSLGNAIMDAIEGVCDTLDWKLINHAVQGVASGLADFINSIFARKGVFEKVGETIGKALNTAVDAGLTLLTKINFKQAAESIVAGLNRAVQTIRWDKIGELLGKGLGSALEFLHTAITEFDWAGLTSGIASGLNTFVSALREKIAGLDWKKIGLSLADGLNHLLLETNWREVGAAVSDIIKSLLDMAFSFLANVNWQALGEAIADFILGIDWIGIAGRLIQIGAMLIAGLFQGMLAFAGKIVLWLKEHIVDPIVEGLRKLFGVHSPSTVMAEIGGYLVEGLFKGIADGAKNINKLLKSKVAQPIQKFFKDPIGTVKLAVDDSWKATQQVWESVKNSEAVKTIEGYVRRTFDSAKASFDTLTSGSVVKYVNGFLEKSFDDAKTVFNNFRDADVFKRVKGELTRIYESVKSTFDSWTEGDAWKYVKGELTNAYASARSTFDAWKQGDAWKYVKGELTNTYDSARSTFDAWKQGDAWKYVKGEITNVYDSVKSTFDAWTRGDVWKYVMGSVEPEFDSAKLTFDAFKDGNATKHLMGETDRSFTDAQTTFNSFKDEPVKKIVQAVVEKAGTWVADAWTAVQMTASTVKKTVQGAVEKAGTWVSDAWTAIQAGGQTARATIQAAVQQAATSGSNWVADAWTAIKAGGQTAKTTIQTVLQQAATSGSNWVADAWTAVKAAGTTTKATVQTVLEKSYNWASDAWTALGNVGKVLNTTVQVTAERKNNYGDVAKTWSVLTGDSVITRTFQIGVQFLNTALQSVKNWLGLKAIGGILAGGVWRNIPQFAGGGIIRGIAGQVQAYAGGTTRAHGSLFLAGEAGPEVVAHINGRTEVLNRSQIASAIYSAVLAGMESAVNGLAAYVSQRMTDCANAIIGATITATQISGPIPVKLIGEDFAALKQLSFLSTAFAGLSHIVPVYSTGTITPYAVDAAIKRQTSQLQQAIDEAKEEMISAHISVMGSSVQSLISAIQQYGGGNGGAGFDADAITQHTIDEINRRTMSMGRSPLLG